MTSIYSERAREALARHDAEIRDVLTKCGASNPRLSGSVARGVAGPGSDIDLMVDLDRPGAGSRLLRLSGIRRALEQILDMRVNISCEELLKGGISMSVRKQAVAL